MGVDTGHYDFIVVGSGFGGSVSALRLTERGYRVLVLEQGSELRESDFPKTNWQLHKWLWMPRLGFRGLFRMSFFRHITVLSGVGVGGGSLVYASTHPTPEPSFFTSGSWASMTDWRTELAPHYDTARRMLGVTRTPMLTEPDVALQALAKEDGKAGAFQSTDVAIYFGKPGVEVPDPYFDGEAPPRTGCIRCGGCMTGCRHGAKNTLDRNYLHLAQSKGAQLFADTEVTAVRPHERGYFVVAKQGRGRLWGRRSRAFTADQVVFAGGVLGTTKLLLKMKADPNGLPKLSDKLGDGVRTNSESLIGVTRPRGEDLSTGVAIGSVYQTDEHSHLEPVRYRAGSGFFRLMMAPHLGGTTLPRRILSLAGILFRRPLAAARGFFVRDWAKSTSILLYMRTIDGTLRLRRGLFGLSTSRDAGDLPTASIPEATALAERMRDKLGGSTYSLATETLLNIPTTAHILGGCAIGPSPKEGVIDGEHRLYGYDGLYVVDGSVFSSNPGVNPSLTITALAERAMSFIPEKPRAG